MNTEEKYMNSITNEIVAIKTEVWERNWKELCLECQQSGLSVKEWCRQNGIHPSTYYARLRKLRKKVCQDIVAIESESQLPQPSEIKITSGEIVVSLPMNASTETISTVLRALKTC